MSKGAQVIYIVESDESVKQGLSRLVQSAGLEARPCGKLKEFLERAAEESADCALLDLSGEDLSEPGLRSKLRALTADVPVIALSVRDDAGARRLAREIGARAFFRKPVDAAALLDSIDWLTLRDPKDKRH